MTDRHAASVKAWDKRGRSGGDGSGAAGGAGRPESEGLGSWTPDGEWVSNGSPESQRWGEGKGVLPGDAPVPFPVWTKADRDSHAPGAQDWWTGNRPTPEMPPAKVQAPAMIRVDSLIATQHVATPKNVARIAQKLKDGEYHDRKPITVLQVGGKNLIYNGHHRAVAHKVAGRSEVLAEVFVVS